MMTLAGINGAGTIKFELKTVFFSGISETYEGTPSLLFPLNQENNNWHYIWHES